MKTYTELKTEREARLTKRLEDNKVFFAFSVEQFAEGLEKIGYTGKGNEIARLGMGGYIPHINSEAFIKGGEEDQKWFDRQIQDLGLEEAQIRYELANHEAWYTYEIDATMSALAGRYTEEKVWEVFYKYADQYE